jgi:hypothetical protein
MIFVIDDVDISTNCCFFSNSYVGPPDVILSCCILTPPINCIPFSPISVNTSFVEPIVIGKSHTNIGCGIVGNGKFSLIISLYISYYLLFSIIYD